MSGGALSGIVKVHWGKVGEVGPLRCYAVWPQPVDHDRCFEQAGFTLFADSDAVWDESFFNLVANIVDTLEPFGALRVVEGELPVQGSRLLRAAFRGSIVDALVCAATNDQFPACSVEFGLAPEARIRTSDGHPILWITLRAPRSIEELLSRFVDGVPTVETNLNWSILGDVSAITTE